MTGNQLVAAAESFLGWRYIKIDCVALVTRSYLKLGLSCWGNDQRPTTVTRLLGSWKGTKHAMPFTPSLGNVLIWKDHTGALVHAGVALDGLHCISSITPAVAITRIDGLRDHQLAYVLEDPRFNISPIVPAPQVYTVQAGDSWVRIARAHGTTASRLQAKNPGHGGLRPGQVINL
jgi:LysM repeat protein